MSLTEIARQVVRAGRTLTHAPLFVLCTAGTLAIGIGLSTAMLAAVDTLLLKPPPGVRDPGGLVTVGISNYPDYSAAVAQTSTLQLAARTTNAMLLQRGEESPVRVEAECVAGSYFSMLGVSISAQPVDDGNAVHSGGAPIVLSRRMWVQQFSADPEIVGRSVRMAGKSFQIAGVAPAGFRGLADEPIDVWVPITASPEACSFTGSNLLASTHSAWLSVVGRLRPGVTLEHARTELATLGMRSNGDAKSWTVDAFGSKGTVRGRSDALLIKLLALAALALLLVACNNVTLLFVSRAYERQRESLIRTHLGASRARLLFEVLVEGVWLAVISVAGAVIVTSVAWTLLGRILSPLTGEVWLSVRSLATLAILSFVSVSFTLVPSCAQVLRVAASPFSRIGSATASDRAFARQALVALQFALALVLAMAAQEFVNSLINVRGGLGYDVEDVIVASADFRAAGINREAAQRGMLDEAVDLLKHLPQVSAIGTSSTGPLGTAKFTTVLPSLRTGDTALERTVSYVSPGYFAAMGTAIRQGRSFADGDSQGAPAVAIVDEGLARATWPGRDVLGACVTEISLDRTAGCVQIVGISAPRRLRRLTKPVGEVFFPLAQGPMIVPEALFIRTSAPVDDALPLVSAALRGRSQLGAITVRPLSQLVDAQARIWIVGSRVFTTLGSLAEVLAAIGIYGTLALSVRRRTPEIAIRAALGADPRRIASLVAFQAAAPMACGWAAGLLTALWTAGLWRTYLFGITPVDLKSVLSASTIMVLAGCLGAFAPTLRATRLSPAEALRAAES